MRDGGRNKARLERWAGLDCTGPRDPHKDLGDCFQETGKTFKDLQQGSCDPTAVMWGMDGVAETEKAGTAVRLFPVNSMRGR